jgi:hypothetical protein
MYIQEVNVSESDDSFLIFTETLSAGQMDLNGGLYFDVCVIKTGIIDIDKD